MNHNDPEMRAVYVGMAAIAGAVTSLSLVKWHEISWPDRLMTMFVGASFAVFFVPWVVGDLMHVDISSLRYACGITYIGATGAPTFIPPILRYIRKKIGTEDVQ